MPSKIDYAMRLLEFARAKEAGTADNKPLALTDREEKACDAAASVLVQYFLGEQDFADPHQDLPQACEPGPMVNTPPTPFNG